MKDAASATALLVARGIAYCSTHPRYGEFVRSEAGELSRRFVEAAGARGRSGASRVDRLRVAIEEWLTVPGLTAHYAMRKRCIESHVHAAFRDRFMQLVILGAGLDTLALRLRGPTRIEIDHPATQQLKWELLVSLGATVTELPTFLAVDFTREGLADALARCHAYEADAPTIFVAEAVFLYLDEAEVRGVLRVLRARPAKTRLVFTFFAPRKRGAINFQNATWIADLYLRMHGEPARWAIAPEDVAAFLASEGFVLRDLVRDVEFHAPFANLARGEHIAVAEAS